MKIRCPILQYLDYRFAWNFNFEVKLFENRSIFSSNKGEVSKHMYHAADLCCQHGQYYRCAWNNHPVFRGKLPSTDRNWGRLVLHLMILLMAFLFESEYFWLHGSCLLLAFSAICLPWDDERPWWFIQYYFDSCWQRIRLFCRMYQGQDTWSTS